MRVKEVVIMVVEVSREKLAYHRQRIRVWVRWVRFTWNTQDG